MTDRKTNRGQSPIFAAAFAAALAFPGAAGAQGEEARTLELEGGGRIAYTVRMHPANAHLARPAGELAPTSALDAAKLLNLHLSSGDIEEAALLSNAPRRRFEVLRDYRESVGAEEFKRVFAQYFYPENRLLAEIAIGRHRLLVWDLKEGATRIAGQFFVEVEGRYLVDDVPNDTRTSLRWVLEGYRSGKLTR
jgi:hypothetical protein